MESFFYFLFFLGKKMKVPKISMILVVLSVTHSLYAETTGSPEPTKSKYEYGDGNVHAGHTPISKIYYNELICYFSSDKEANLEG